MLDRRGSGILLHLTSLPSPYGIGDLGSGACRFIDFLAAARQRYWQILPLNPTEPALYNSPYLSTSAFAGNPLLISPDLMLREGWLTPADLASVPVFARDNVDYRTVSPYKEALLRRAYERFSARPAPTEFDAFRAEHGPWLEDFALFMALRARFSGRTWSDWPLDLRDRDPQSLQAARNDLADRVRQEEFRQYVFARQWASLKKAGNEKGVQIIGDIPIYVAYDSADLWAHPELFNLGEDRKPSAVAGVPPDYFSATGQRWGNPLYRWGAMRENGYAWWTARIARNLTLFDLVRIDHFRGLVAYWEIPAAEETAVRGRWVEAPAVDFFTHLKEQFPALPFIAEDLGIITPDVREVMDRFHLPGMKVLLFAFGDDLASNPYIPHNLPRRCLAYTGTHDNNTIRGWFEKDATPDEKKKVFSYLGREVAAADLPREFIRLLMMSAADTVILPMQDLLGLGEEARMNRPSTLGGNWEWRLPPDLLNPEVGERLRTWTEIYGRACPPLLPPFTFNF